MDHKEKALNILSSGVTTYSSILYYIGITIMMIILLYNIYALFRNLKDYINNNKYIQNVKATIEKLNKEKIGSLITKNTKYSSTSKDQYHYNLTLSFMINNEKITIDKEEVFSCYIKFYYFLAFFNIFIYIYFIIFLLSIF